MSASSSFYSSRKPAPAHRYTNKMFGVAATARQRMSGTQLFMSAKGGDFGASDNGTGYEKYFENTPSNQPINIKHLLKI